MERFIERDIISYEIPAWAKAENMEQSYSHAQLWQMRHHGIVRNENKHVIRKFVAKQLVKMANYMDEEISFSESIKGYAKA